MGVCFKTQWGGAGRVDERPGDAGRARFPARRRHSDGLAPVALRVERRRRRHGRILPAGLGLPARLPPPPLRNDLLYSSQHFILVSYIIIYSVLLILIEDVFSITVDVIKIMIVISVAFI